MSIFKGTTEPKKIYIWVDATPITTAGIYHNEELGLISLSSDGSNWITIADKNIGATGTSGDNAKGNVYQRGNNYGFPSSGSVTTSTSQVNAQNYGPTNYYSSSTFIVRSSSPYKWDSSGNTNLRGDTTNTNIARKGPCDTGFHVPSKSEAESLLSTATSLLGTLNQSKLQQYLLFIHGLFRVYNSGSVNTGYTFLTATSTYSSGDYYYVFRLSSGTPTVGTTFTTAATQIRPFKNEAAQPRVGWDTIYDPNWTITFNSLGNTVVVDSNTPPTATLHYSTTKAANCTSTDTSVATVTGSGNSITITILGPGTCSIYEGTFFVCQLTVS